MECKESDMGLVLHLRIIKGLKYGSNDQILSGMPEIYVCETLEGRRGWDVDAARFR